MLPAKSPHGCNDSHREYNRTRGPMNRPQAQTARPPILVGLPPTFYDQPSRFAHFSRRGAYREAIFRHATFQLPARTGPGKYGA